MMITYSNGKHCQETCYIWSDPLWVALNISPKGHSMIKSLCTSNCNGPFPLIPGNRLAHASAEAWLYSTLHKCN